MIGQTDENEEKKHRKTKKLNYVLDKQTKAAEKSRNNFRMRQLMLVAVCHLQLDIDSFSDTTNYNPYEILHFFAVIPNFNFIIPNLKRNKNFVSAHPERRKITRVRDSFVSTDDTTKFIQHVTQNC